MNMFVYILGRIPLTIVVSSAKWKPNTLSWLVMVSLYADALYWVQCVYRVYLLCVSYEISSIELNYINITKSLVEQCDGELVYWNTFSVHILIDILVALYLWTNSLLCAQSSAPNIPLRSDLISSGLQFFICDFMLVIRPSTKQIILRCHEFGSPIIWMNFFGFIIFVSVTNWSHYHYHYRSLLLETTKHWSGRSSTYDMYKRQLWTDP